MQFVLQHMFSSKKVQVYVFETSTSKGYSFSKSRIVAHHRRIDLKNCRERPACELSLSYTVSKLSRRVQFGAFMLCKT